MKNKLIVLFAFVAYCFSADAEVRVTELAMRDVVPQAWATRTLDDPANHWFDVDALAILMMGNGSGRWDSIYLLICLPEEVFIDLNSKAVLWYARWLKSTDKQTAQRYTGQAIFGFLAEYYFAER